VTLELAVKGTVRPVGRFIGWSPTPAALRIEDDGGAAGPLTVRLRTAADAVGKLELRAERKDDPADELTVVLPADGSPAEFLVAGRFGSPSASAGDAVLEVVGTGADAPVLGAFPMTVRVRKDADTLSVAERDAFLLALTTLDDQGAGLFQTYRNIHREGTLDEAHGFDGFLPWHRAYLLDVERELQNIDPAVSLHHWRWDKPAPRLFSADYLGAPDPDGGFAVFSSANPLRLWTIDGRQGIDRQPLFDVATEAAHNAAGQPTVADAAVTGFAGTYRQLRPPFELNPHGRAHVSFSGDIFSPPTAPRDPLFFLLHSNVDRLWAKWQWLQQRFDPSKTTAYGFGGRAGDPGATRVGGNLLDTMWPWNAATTPPRPPTAPRQPFPGALLSAPENRPTVRSMIDFQGVHDDLATLGFDYADVPYQPDVP
jgi:tyrosinase